MTSFAKQGERASLAVVTIEEVLALTPQEVTRDTRWLCGCYFSHVSELRCVAARVQFETDGPVEVEGVEIRVVRHVGINIDGDVVDDSTERRFWRLAVVVLDGDPVMIIRNAGREGDDHATRIVIDPGLYGELLTRLITVDQWQLVGCAVPDVLEDSRTCDAALDKWVEADPLDAFYGLSLASTGASS